MKVLEAWLCQDTEQRRRVETWLETTTDDSDRLTAVHYGAAAYVNGDLYQPPSYGKTLVEALERLDNALASHAGALLAAQCKDLKGD